LLKYDLLAQAFSGLCHCDRQQHRSGRCADVHSTDHLLENERTSRI